MSLRIHQLDVDVETKTKDDVFVHYSAIKQDGYKSLLEGQIVEYELLETLQSKKQVLSMSDTHKSNDLSSIYIL